MKFIDKLQQMEMHSALYDAWKSKEERNRSRKESKANLLLSKFNKKESMPVQDMLCVTGFAAMLEQLEEIHFDGSAVQKPFWYRLLWEDDPKKRAIERLRKAQNNTKRVVQDIQSYAGLSSLHDDIQDMRLNTKCGAAR